MTVDLAIILAKTVNDGTLPDLAVLTIMIISTIEIQTS